MNKIFFDANIILDMIDEDRGNIDAARKLAYQILVKNMTLYTSCDILSNIYYVARKKLDKEILIKEMLRILEIFEIIEIDKQIARKALLLNREQPRLDFEDVLQSECASKVSCDLIVTNDKKFADGEIRHLSLTEALKII